MTNFAHRVAKSAFNEQKVLFAKTKFILYKFDNKALKFLNCLQENLR